MQFVLPVLLCANIILKIVGVLAWSWLLVLWPLWFWVLALLVLGFLSWASSK